MYVKRVFCKTYVYLNVRQTYVSRKKIYFNAWVVIGKHKAFKGMVNACFSYHALNKCFFFSKRMYNVW